MYASMQFLPVSSSGASITVASGRARSTRNWGRAREGSREGERREAKRLREKLSISWQFCRFLVMLLSPSFKALVSPSLPPLRAHRFRSEREIWERGISSYRAR